MVEVVPNPEGCSKFDPNPFKKEKCKQCGRLWNEHKGVIDEALLQGHLKAIQKVAQDKQQKEAEEQAKAKAKKALKKRTSAAVEDEWFFDGPKDEKAVEADSDDDMGFQMFSAENLDAAPIEKRRQQGNSEPPKPFKVVNLIDFGECDLPEDRPPEGFGGSTTSSDHSAGGPSSCAAAMATDRHLGRATSAPIVAPTDGHFGAAPSPPFEVHAEIMHLRQRLASLDEERRLQVDILSDDLAEKTQLIGDLQRQQREAEVALREARAELERQLNEANSEREEAQALLEHERAEAERHRIEAEQLRAESQADSQAEVPPDVSSLVGELRELCLRMRASLAGGAEPESEWAEAQGSHGGGGLEAELRSLREAVLAAHAAAERAAAERRQLALSLEHVAQQRPPPPAAEPAEAPTGGAAPAEPVADAQADEAPEAEARAPEAPEEPSAKEGREERVLVLHPDLAEAHAQLVGRNAVQVIRDIRLSAEQHLAWINKRMRAGPQAMPAQA